MARNQLRDKQRVINQLAEAGNASIACRRAQIPRATCYAWRKEDSEFAEAWEEALRQGNDLVNDMAESQLVTLIQDKNIRAIIFRLSHHHPNYAPQSPQPRKSVTIIGPARQVLIAAGILKDKSNKSKNSFIENMDRDILNRENKTSSIDI